MIQKKIGILTLPLHTNYGGIIQAYSLMEVLNTMGHNVCLLQLVIKIKFDIHNPKTYILSFPKFYNTITNFLAYFPTKYKIMRFANKHLINRSRYLYSEKALKDEIKKLKIDVLIVGSDQVWRPLFTQNNIYNYYLNFLRNDLNIKKITYAASFGTEKWEYNNLQTEKCKTLIKKFDAVSVRESSAVKLCKEHFEIDAIQLLDPTMLLKKEDYQKIIKPIIQPQGELFLYFLDENSAKKLIVNKIEEHYNYKSFTIKKQKRSFYIPTVYDWLAGFENSKLIITDSFHGCIFSIIFNKPFYVIGNEERGLTRFSSLLEMFKLEDRIIVNEENFLSTKAIDWDNVNKILDERRKFAYSFLVNSMY